MDHIPRRDVIDAGVGERQSVGETLMQAHRQAARRGRLAHHRRARQAVDRFDIEAYQRRLPLRTR